MKRKKWIKWAILLAAAAAAAVWLGLMGGKGDAAAYNETVVQLGSLTTYYHFDGVVHAKHSQTITAQAADTVRSVYVVQNQQVRKGDRLYRTDGGETVKAEIDGEVTGLYIHEGDVIAAGAKTAEIIDLENLEVQLSVDEYDVGAMTKGKAAEVTVLAQGAAYDGVVTALDKNGTASGDLSYYTAYVDLEKTEGVYPGMQVSAKVLRSHAENAVLLKMDAVQFDEYNKPYVLVRRKAGEEPVHTPVTVGASDGVTCVIESGLAAGDTVCVKNGMSVMELMIELDKKTR